MDIRSLRYFLAVAEAGNLSRAARDVRISQPAISRQIQRLEQELGRPLFDRRGHGVTLTDAGRRLSEHAQDILRQLQKAAEEVREDSDEPSGTVTLAVPPAAGTFLVPALAEHLKASLPRVTLRVVAGYSSLIHEWLARGLADLACLHDPQPQRGFRITPLLREEVFLVGRPDLLSRSSAPVRIDDVFGMPLVLPSRSNTSRRLLDGWAARRGKTLQPRLEVDDTSIIRSLLRAGAGVSLLSRGSFQAELMYGELVARPLLPKAYWPLALVRPTPGAAPRLRDLVASEVIAVTRRLVSEKGWPGSNAAPGLPKARAADGAPRTGRDTARPRRSPAGAPPR